jgi:hypothetical protein
MVTVLAPRGNRRDLPRERDAGYGGSASGNRTPDLRITSAIKKCLGTSRTVYPCRSALDPRIRGPPWTPLDGAHWSPKWHRRSSLDDHTNMAGPPAARTANGP